MKSRVVAIVVAVLVPLVVVSVVVARRDSAKRAPARLPIVASGRTAPGAVDAALAPYGGMTYTQGPNLPALAGSTRAYRVRTNDVAGLEQRVAGALGIHGAPQADGTGALVLTDGDAQLTVTSTEWNYSRTSSDNAVASSGTAVACAPDADCPADTIAPAPTPSRP